MKVLFLGTSEFGIPSLEALLQSKNIDVIGIITQPDKPAGRKQKITPSPVKTYADKKGLKIHQPKNKEQLLNITKKLNVDFFVVISYGMILSKKIISVPKISCINVHASILPKYRGASPIQECLKNGDHETGVTFMKMDEKLDHGNIYLVKRTKINKYERFSDLHNRLSIMAGIMLPHILLDIQEQNLKSIPQNHKQASYCSKIKKEDGKINWNDSAENIFNKFRAYNLWPELYFEYKNKNFKILDLEITDKRIDTEKFVINDKKLLVGTKTFAISIKKIQPQGKKEMEIENFINGYKNLFET